MARFAILCVPYIILFNSDTRVVNSNVMSEPPACCCRGNCCQGGPVNGQCVNCEGDFGHKACLINITSSSRSDHESSDHEQFQLSVNIDDDNNPQFFAVRGYGLFPDLPSGSTIPDNETIHLAGYCYFCAILDLETSLTGQFVPLHNGTSTCQDHSHGLLCGYCDDGYYRNLGGQCVACDNSRLVCDWFLYLASQFVPITVWFFALLFMNKSLIGGALNSAIFFAQMVTTTMDLNGDGFIPISNLTEGNPHIAYGVESVYHLIYQPFNLNFFYPFVKELCLLKTPTYLPYLALQYIVAFYPLVLIGIVLFVNWLDNHNVTITEKCRMFLRCCIPENIFQSSPKVFASFMLLSYQKFVLISAMLINFNRLIKRNGDTARYVPFYDPSFHYFKGSHIVYAVIAILIYLFAFALPILLVVICHNKQQQKCKWINDFILEPFQKHYRQRCNGKCCKHHRLRLHESRWVAGLYFLLRLALLTIFVFAPSSYRFIVQFVLQQLVCLVAAVFFFIYQPYAKNWHNKLDAFFLLLLAFINTLSIYQYFLTTDDRPLSLPAFIAQYILILVPFLWMVGNCIYKVLAYKYCHGDSEPVKDGGLTHPPREDKSILLTSSGSLIAGDKNRSVARYGMTDN